MHCHYCTTARHYNALSGALLADEEKKLQDLLDVVVTESERKGLEINKKKSFVIVMSEKTTAPVCHVTVKRERLEQ